ncbi:MAG: TonB-dependent receptor [Bacteroidota bacterium]
MKNLLTLLLLTTVCLNASALLPKDEKIDSKKGIIKATIIDGKNNIPIEYANVTVHNSSDSTFITGSASGKNGELLIPNLPEGNYYVKVSFIGYDKTIISNIAITPDKKEVFLGVIKINPTEIKMDAVNVVGEKPIEEYHLDKRVINVSKDNTAAGGTALDVLQNHPSIQVDQNGNVTLRGSSNFTVLVNGRPGVLQGSDALRQIPANIIDNIELITNPSAKYDAEGAAGIVNIITKVSAYDNMSGIINGGIGSRTKYNGDVTVNYKSGDWGITGSGDYRLFSNSNHQDYDRYTSTSTASMYQKANINQSFRRKNFNAKLGIDYAITPVTGISFTNSIGRFSFNGNFMLNGSALENSSSEISKYTTNKQLSDITANYFQSIIYFNHQFKPKVDELTFEAVYTNLFQPNLQTSREYITDSKHENWSINPATTENNSTANHNDGRIKLNYSYKFNEKSKFETGVQANLAYRNFDCLFRTFNWNNNDWMTDPTYTNEFDFRNNIYSAFATYSNSFEALGLDYQLGLRAEQTDRQLHQITLNKDYDYNQTHLFPSVSLLKKINQAQQLQFSYSRRINRPFEGALNPFPRYSDSYALVIGNPELKPELVNSLELNYQNTIGGVFLSAQTYYRNTKNTFQQTALIGPDGRLNLSFGNIAKTYSIGSEVSAGVSIAQWFRIDPSLNLYKTHLEGKLKDNSYEQDGFVWAVRLRSTLYFSPETRFQAALFYTAKQKILQGEIDPIVNLTLSLRQEFLDKKLIVTATAQNLFNTGRFKLFTDAGNGTFFYLNVRPEAPVFNITLSYNFNNFKNPSKVNDRVDVNVNTGF